MKQDFIKAVKNWSEEVAFHINEIPYRKGEVVLVGAFILAVSGAATSTWIFPEVGNYIKETLGLGG